MNEYIHPMDRRDPNWLSAADESRQELNEHLERKSWINDGPDCYCREPGCDRRLVYGSCPIHDRGPA